MVPKLKQDTVTSILFAMFILFITVTGMMTVALLPPSGGGWSDGILTRVYTDDLDAPLAHMQTQGSNGFNGCGVIYQQASLGRTQVAGSSAAEHAVMGNLYPAVYTCTGRTITTDSYI